jgi:hypothetical protein
MHSMKDLLGDNVYALPEPGPKDAFDGETYNHKRDHYRLAGQLERVFRNMEDGRWRSLETLAMLAGGTEASVSARLRDLRKEKYGSHNVERKHIRDGLWLYRLIVTTD